MKKYEESLRVISSSDKPETERADNLIREMCKLTDALLDYRYAVENYNKGTALADGIGKVKNCMALVMGDMEILMDQLDITNKVRQKKVDRINKLADKIRRN